MPRILVNCHGGRVTGPDEQPPPFEVPENVPIHFYIDDGDLLDDGEAWQILTHRLQFIPGDPNNIITIGPGGVCADYFGLPYNALEVVNGVQLERVGRHQRPYFDTILETGPGQNWGNPARDTIQTQRVMLPAIHGGQPYARSVITLSDIARCPGVTDVDWISCREHW